MKRHAQNRASILIGLLITALLASLLYFRPPWLKAVYSSLDTLEDKLYDYRFIVRGPLYPPDKIVIAAIDEKSIAKLGRYPWDRDKLALLVDRLDQASAGLIVFDIILSETEKNDPRLAEAMNNAGNVLLPIVFIFDKPNNAVSDQLLQSAFFNVNNSRRFSSYSPITAPGILIPVPGLIREVMSLGHINMFADSDGTLRWESLVIAYNGRLYPSLTLRAAATYLGVPPEKISLDATKAVHLGGLEIPTNAYGQMLINYYGGNQTFRQISISDILDGTVDPKLLTGKIVLIGATAVGIYDLRVTPYSPAMPGIEKHASVIASILEQKLLKKAPLVTDVAALMLTGIIFTLLIARLNAAGAASATALAVIFFAATAHYFFARKGVWINVAYPTINVLLIFVSITAYNYEVEEKFAKQIRAMFSSYVTERVVNELIKNPDMARLGGERREITVLFSDVRSFTTFSEKYAPEEVVAILNEYLAVMTEVVFRWEGTLDKFIGDAILAFWGAPMKQDNHAELAVKCALDMMCKLRTLQEKWKSEGKEVLEIGIGINTGEVLVGNIGAEGKKMDYTVIGDHVNLGSRVEGLTKKFHASILITETTLSRIRPLIESNVFGHVAITGREKVIVKGKERPVGIYAVEALEPGQPSYITECEEDKISRMHEK